jgi:hypothetical protein
MAPADAAPSALAGTFLSPGSPEAIAPTSRTDGVTVLMPVGRSRVTSSCQVRRVWSFSAARVSV